MQAHRGWLASVVYARLRDSHAVDEVLQETALAASRQKHLADDLDGVCRWLYRVALRQAILYRRKQVRANRRLQEAGTRTDALNRDKSDNKNPYQILVASENRELVRIALTKLSNQDCEILMLKYNESWSCRDMANRLGVSESALKSRLLRARKNLRNVLLTLDNNWDMT